ncbi:MAG: T9SS type A sorting domain-containing protein [Cyclobacteriaceae bacterium]
MKHRNVIMFGASLIGLFILFQEVEFSTTEEKYQKHILEAFEGVKLEGPEKSTARDVLMTMNPKTGEIPVTNVQEHFAAKRKGRASETDFKWEQINTEIAGRVRAIMVDPNDGNKLWAGAVTGGLWYSSDFRNNSAWIPVSDDWESLSISSISFDPNNTQTFYVGTGESFTSVNIYRESTSAGAGIYKTTDGGTTWTLLSSTTAFDYVNDIVVRDEEGTSVIYAGVASGIYQGNIFSSSPSDGLFRSADGGITWTQVLPNIAGESVPYAVSDIELTSSGDLFVGTMRNLEIKGAGLILNSSDGLTWQVEDRHVTQITSEFGSDAIPGRVRLASQGDIVYAVATGGFLNSANQIRDNPNFTRIMRLEGGTWSDLAGPPNSWASIPWHALAIGVDPNNSDRLAIGGLNAHALSSATAGSLSWVEVSDWASMYHFSDYLIPYFGLQNSDSVTNHFVHADIHAIEFVGSSSDEVLFSNDGGVHFSADFTKSFGIPSGERLDEYSSFKHVNNSFATTQYYTVALHPDAGNNEVLAGSQDNSTHTNEDGAITYAHMIGGGDGAYCFFDQDDPDLRITSSQVNNYNIWIGEVGYFYGFGSGTFINPAEYDDRSNLLYANVAVDGGFEMLITSLQGQLLDNIAILNINPFLEKDMLGLDTLSYITLGTNTTTAFSFLKLSPHDDAANATMILGNQLGDIYRVTGLPNNPASAKIDNDQLPVGYVSSIDIGDTNGDILVTLSNYGVESVWHTRNGGVTWNNLDRNLPDVPVRHGIFNPLDDQQIILATETGIWGLENALDESSEWISYNANFPNVRVDMIKARGSDSVIVAATHGRGLFLGKFSQGQVVEEVLAVDPIPNYSVYPNPTSGNVYFDFEASSVQVFSIEGKLLEQFGKGQEVDLSRYEKGVYLLRITDNLSKTKSFRILKEE